MPAPVTIMDKAQGARARALPRSRPGKHATALEV